MESKIQQLEKHLNDADAVIQQQRSAVPCAGKQANGASNTGGQQAALSSCQAGSFQQSVPVACSECAGLRQQLADAMRRQAAPAGPIPGEDSRHCDCSFRRTYGHYITLIAY